ncbi:MAG TPA: CorA family divalent cation transporter [Thermoleophilaceae bacterium]
MGEILRGLNRERAAALRAEGRFFWADLVADERTRGELRDVLGLPDHALQPLLEFDPQVHRSRKFHVDGDHVVFLFSCFVEDEPVEVHVLVSGDYVLTAHSAPVSLPDVLEIESPQGRSEQYLIYAVLEAMLITHFDKLTEVDDKVEELLGRTVDLRSTGVRNETLRQITSDLTRARRQVAPLRGTFARVSHEIGRVEGLEPDSEHYFDYVGDQINRLVEAIDAAADSVTRMIDLRLNETTYWLTVVATVFLPLTFVTGFFGMNFGWLVRHINSPAAFFLLGVGSCLVGVVATLLAIRRRSPVEPERSQSPQ